MRFIAQKLAVLAAAVFLCAGAATVRAADDADRTSTPRQLYNDGATNLGKGQLTEAEACFTAALATQNERVQAPSLYNLGEVRFLQGYNELTNGPQPGSLADSSKTASEKTATALHEIDDALAQEEISKMVDAYMHGRGARKDLNAATEAVRKALDSYGAVLTKWRRASGDFKSTVELTPADLAAQTNADRVDGFIAKLVDLQQMMLSMRNGMGRQKEELRQKMQQLKMKIPNGSMAMPTDSDDDEDGEQPKDPKDLKGSEQDNRGNSGREYRLTPAEAMRLLELLKLDPNRKLSLGGFEETAKPVNRKGADW